MKITWKQCFQLGVTLLVIAAVITKISSIENCITLLYSASFPLLLGAIIAYAVNIPMAFYERNFFSKVKSQKILKFKRPLCLVLAVLTLLLVISAVSALVIPKLVSCIALMIETLPISFKKVEIFITESEMLSSFISEDFTSALHNIDWNNFISGTVNVVSKGVGDFAQTLSKAAISVFSGVASFIMSFIFAIYLLANKEMVFRQFNKLSGKLIRKDINHRIKTVLGVFNESLHNFLVGQCIEACIIGVLCIIGMLILRFENAVLIGTLIGFTALIPIAGAYIGAAIGALILLTVSPMTSLFFLIFIIVLQQLEGNIIYPKVVGSSIGLPGTWTFAAVVVGGGLYGISGMLIGVPLAATIYKLLKHYTKHPRRSKN